MLFVLLLCLAGKARELLVDVEATALKDIIDYVDKEGVPVNGPSLDHLWSLRCRAEGVFIRMHARIIGWNLTRRPFRP